MRARVFLCSAAVAIVCVYLAPPPAFAQAQAAKTSGNASTYAPPKTPDGQPDISGFYNGGAGVSETNSFEGFGDVAPYDRVWGADTPTAQAAIKEQAAREASGQRAAPAPPGPPPGQAQQKRISTPDNRIPYQAWARAKKTEYIGGQVGNPKGIEKIEYIDPVMRCLPAGIPRAAHSVYAYNGLQFLQPPGYVVILTEWNHLYRIIPMDNRPHVSKNIKLWMGDSRGHWEGNTLVVDWTNSNGRTWMNQGGSFHSDAIHITERFTLTGPNSMSYEARIEDPNVYTEPWTFTSSFERALEPGYELYEYACTEGNRAVDNALIKR